jgi:hypothetical protein
MTAAVYQIVASNGMVLACIYAEDDWTTTSSSKLSWTRPGAS